MLPTRPTSDKYLMHLCPVRLWPDGNRHRKSRTLKLTQINTPCRNPRRKTASLAALNKSTANKVLGRESGGAPPSTPTSRATVSARSEKAPHDPTPSPGLCSALGSQLLCRLPLATWVVESPPENLTLRCN